MLMEHFILYYECLISCSYLRLISQLLKTATNNSEVPCCINEARKLNYLKMNMIIYYVSKNLSILKKARPYLLNSFIS